MATAVPIAFGAVFVHADSYQYLQPLPWLKRVDVELRWWLSEYYQATTVVVRPSQLSSPASARQALATALESVRGCDILLLGLAGHVQYFKRRTGDIRALALPGSVPGRPTSGLPLSSIAAAVRDSRSDGTPVIVCADLAPTTQAALLDPTVQPADAVLLGEFDAFDVLVAARGQRAGQVTCHNAVAYSLGELALAGRPASVKEIVESAAAKLRESGVSVVATTREQPNAVVGPGVNDEFLPDYVRADLCSFDPGSRLDAVAELAELADTGNPIADRHLRRLQSHDPVGSVRTYAESVRRRAAGVTAARLVAAGVMPAAVYDEAKAGTDVPDLIPQLGGWVSVGVDAPDGQIAERPRHSVWVEPFRLARTPTTNRQYLAYIVATGSTCPPYWTDAPALWLGPDLPTVMVSWDDAAGYCDWLTRHLHGAHQLHSHESILLPSEAEWECAASNARADPHPWGSQTDPARANVRATGTNAVVAPGSFSPGGDNDAGCQDLIGNVWEWTRSKWGSSGRTPSYLYPYDGTDGREDAADHHDIRFVIRGGAYYYATECANSYTRNQMPANKRHPAGGFRVACLAMPKAAPPRDA